MLFDITYYRSAVLYAPVLFFLLFEFSSIHLQIMMDSASSKETIQKTFTVLGIISSLCIIMYYSIIMFDISNMSGVVEILTYESRAEIPGSKARINAVMLFNYAIIVETVMIIASYVRYKNPL